LVYSGVYQHTLPDGAGGVVGLPGGFTNRCLDGARGGVVCLLLRMRMPLMTMPFVDVLMFQKANSDREGDA
jgi:hypothetical protein